MTRAFLIKWLLIVLTIKGVLFTYFTFQFHAYAREKQIHSGIAIAMGDTRNYYVPAEEFTRNGNYNSACRMPGLLPFYVPVSWLFGQEPAFVAIIIFQFFLSVLSVLLLAIIAARIFPQRYVFEITAIIYALSTFVSIWDHTLMSDSFSTSFLIFSAFSLSSFLQHKHFKHLLLAGIWLAWAIFLRQITVILLPLYCLILFQNIKDGFGKYIVRCALLASPIVISVGAWTYRNYVKEHQFIPFIKPVADCYETYTPQFLAVNQLLLAWGEDIQYWIPNTPANWFVSAKKETQLFERSRSLETSSCTTDSIMALQHAYNTFRTTEDSLQKELSGTYVLTKTKVYRAEYINEKPLDFLVMNRLKMFKEFVFPSRLDNMPGPAFDKMSLLQKAIKLGYFALLLFVNALGVIASFYLLFKRRWKQLSFVAIAWSFVIVLAIVLGFIEQRYLVPSYPFFLIAAVGFVAELIQTTKSSMDFIR
jgi:hypothetical protein